MKIYVGGIEVLTATQITITDDGAPPPSGTGTQGPPGPAGAVGATGATGPAGAVGATGAQGVQGVPGPAGATGAQGPAGPAGGGTAPPPTNGGGEPPPPQGQDYPTPVPPVIVAWPASGQVVLHVPMQPEQTVCYRLIWKSSMDASKFGRINTVEEPGSAVRYRQLRLNVNGVERFNSPFVDTAPSCGLSNAPTPGSPSQVMMALNDTLDIIITNDDARTVQPANVLVDVMLPDRY
jgi:hypothetical protein